MNGKIEGLLKSESVSKLRAALGDSSVEVVEINGLYSSAKAFAISECISGGVHVIVLQGRDDAAGCVNELYNIKGEGDVCFFSPSDVRKGRGVALIHILRRRRRRRGRCRWWQCHVKIDRDNKW